MKDNRYHYVESELNNVWLANGFEVRQTPVKALRLCLIQHPQKLAHHPVSTGIVFTQNNSLK